MLGIGLGFAIILGLSTPVGSLVPLLVLTPQKVGTSQGHLYFLGTAVMLIEIVAAARAGSLRDLSKKPVDSICGVKIKGSFIAGLVVAISAGLLSSALNFSYAFGTEPSRRHAIWGSLLFGCQTLWQLRQQVAASLPIAFLNGICFAGASGPSVTVSHCSIRMAFASPLSTLPDYVL
jgi:hypothetical protein